MISFVLNIPHTLVGIILAGISIPRSFSLHRKPFAFVIIIKKFWWTRGYMKNARAMAIGNVVILGPNLEKKDLEHELVHIEQYKRHPLIQPILYLIELWKNGYRNNKFEVEAYSRAGNIYKGK